VTRTENKRLYRERQTTLHPKVIIMLGGSIFNVLKGCKRSINTEKKKRRDEPIPNVIKNNISIITPIENES